MKRSSCFAIAVVLALVVSMVIPLLVGANGTVTIRARKYEDLDKSGNYTTGEPYLEGWQIQLWSGLCFSGDCSLTDTKSTNATGEAVWSGLPAGNYTICEVLKSGWHNFEPGTYGCYEHEFEEGADETFWFGNYNLGSITVCKNAVPDDSQQFQFSSPQLGGFGLSDTGGGNCTTFSSKMDGNTYSITEIIPSGWDLLDVTFSGSVNSTCSWDDTDTATIDLGYGDDVTVTFHDYKWGTVTIYKDVVSIHTETQEFEFTGSADIGDFGGFTLDDDGVGDNYDYFELPPGSYHVTELVPDGWDLTGITLNPSATGSVDLGAAKVSFDLAYDEAITCRFENTKRGSIIVEKNTRGGPDGSFTFTGDVAGSIGGGGQLEEDNLVPGEYTVRERIPTGWDLSSIRCDDDNSSGSVGTGTATINLDPGETVTCTYTNSYLAGTPGLPRKHPGAVGRPEPASVLPCYLDVPMVEAMPGQQFDISVNLCNRGGEKATKSVDLLINGHQEQSQTVGLGPGACQTVVFRIFKTVPGTYEVSVMGQVGYFTVMPLYPGYVVREAPPAEQRGIGTAGIVTIVIVLIVLGVGLVLILKKE